MGVTIRLKKHVYNHEWIITPRNLDFCNLSPGSCTPTQPNQSTNSNMWINVLKSSMLESRLITDQWCEPLTSVRETTNNDNCPQGTISTIHRIWIEELKSSICEITRSKANDVNLSSSAKNFALGHASSKVLEGSLSVNFPDNELKSMESNYVKGGP